VPGCPTRVIEFDAFVATLRVMRKISMLCVSVALATIGTTAACSSPPPPPEPVEPIASCVDEAEQRESGVSMTRADSYTVDGLVYGSGTRAAIFANQADGDVCQWQSHAQLLAQKDYLAVVFNYSQFGAKGDVLAAVATVRQRGATEVYLIGASRGGTAVLTAAAAAEPPVDAVVSLSAPRSYMGEGAAVVMPDFTTPVLFMVGESDAPFADETRKLYEACASADKQLEVFDNGRHGVALVDAAVFDQIQDFLARHV
jgi:pimeloyl-ACP methyl ester carboxylesterase